METKESIEKLPTREAFEAALNAGLIQFDHTSIHRGYLHVGCTHVERYAGKFGRGFCVHEETLHSSIRGNSHHYVHYYIFND